MSELTFTRTERAHFPCDCGCGRELPHLVGRVSGDAGHTVELLLAHDQEERILLAAAGGSFPFGEGVFGYEVRVDADDDTAWTPLSPDELPEERLRALDAAPEWPVSWGDDEDAAAHIMALIDVAIRASPGVIDHLYGREEGLDVTFKVPDVLLKPVTGPFEAGTNFVELAERRFVRALVPLLLVGGEELRVGTWFEVRREAYDALRAGYDDAAVYLQQRLEGTCANAFELGGRAALGAKARLAPRHADQGLFVERFTDAALHRALLYERFDDEVEQLVARMKSRPQNPNR